MVCHNVRFGILARHSNPDKRADTLICGECIVMIALGKPIEVDKDTVFGHYSRTEILRTTHRRKPQKRGPKAKTKEQCPYCPKMCSARGMPLHIQAKHPEKAPEKPKDVTPDIEPITETEVVVGEPQELIEKDNGETETDKTEAEKAGNTETDQRDEVLSQARG